MSSRTIAASSQRRSRCRSRWSTRSASPRKRERAFDPGLELVGAAGADRTVDQGAVAEEQQRRDALHAEAGGDAGIVVHVHLHQLELPAQSPRDVFERGEIIRHGPHHGAQRSTTTGNGDRSTTAAKSGSFVSAIHGSHCLQFAQRGLPVALAGTRFFWWQFGHSITIR